MVAGLFEENRVFAINATALDSTPCSRHIVAAGYYKAFIFDSSSVEVYQDVKIRTKFVSRLSCHPHTRIAPLAALVSGSDVGLYSVDSMRQKVRWKNVSGSSRCISDISWNHFDQHLIATCAYYDPTIVRDLRSVRKVAIEIGSSTGAVQVKYSPFMEHMLVTSNSNYVSIWDDRCPKVPLTEFEAHTAPLTCLQWHPRNKHSFFTCSKDGLLRCWDMFDENGDRVHEPDMNERDLSCWRFWFAPDGEEYAILKSPVSLKQPGQIEVYQYPFQENLNPLKIDNSDVFVDLCWNKHPEKTSKFVWALRQNKGLIRHAIVYDYSSENREEMATPIAQSAMDEEKDRMVGGEVEDDFSSNSDYGSPDRERGLFGDMDEDSGKGGGFAVPPPPPLPEHRFLPPAFVEQEQSPLRTSPSGGSLQSFIAHLNLSRHSGGSIPAPALPVSNVVNDYERWISAPNVTGGDLHAELDALWEVRAEGVTVTERNIPRCATGFIYEHGLNGPKLDFEVRFHKSFCENGKILVKLLQKNCPLNGDQARRLLRLMQEKSDQLKQVPMTRTVFAGVVADLRRVVEAIGAFSPSDLDSLPERRRSQTHSISSAVDETESEGSESSLRHSITLSFTPSQLDEFVPAPRTSGAQFDSSGFLVRFGNFRSTHRLQISKDIKEKPTDGTGIDFAKLGIIDVDEDNSDSDESVGPRRPLKRLSESEVSSSEPGEDGERTSGLESLSEEDTDGGDGDSPPWKPKPVPKQSGAKRDSSDLSSDESLDGSSDSTSTSSSSASSSSFDSRSESSATSSVSPCSSFSSSSSSLSVPPTAARYKRSRRCSYETAPLPMIVVDFKLFLDTEPPKDQIFLRIPSDPRANALPMPFVPGDLVQEGKSILEGVRFGASEIFDMTARKDAWPYKVVNEAQGIFRGEDDEEEDEEEEVEEGSSDGSGSTTPSSQECDVVDKVVPLRQRESATPPSDPEGCCSGSPESHEDFQVLDANARRLDTGRSSSDSDARFLESQLPLPMPFPFPLTQDRILPFGMDELEARVRATDPHQSPEPELTPRSCAPPEPNQSSSESEIDADKTLIEPLEPYQHEITPEDWQPEEAEEEWVSQHDSDSDRERTPEAPQAESRAASPFPTDDEAVLKELAAKRRKRPTSVLASAPKSSMFPFGDRPSAPKSLVDYLETMGPILREIAEAKRAAASEEGTPEAFPKGDPVPYPCVSPVRTFNLSSSPTTASMASIIMHRNNPRNRLSSSPSSSRCYSTRHRGSSLTLTDPETNLKGSSSDALVSTPVELFDVSSFLPVSKKLARKYRLLGASHKKLVTHNGRTVEKEESRRKDVLWTWETCMEYIYAMHRTGTRRSAPHCEDETFCPSNFWHIGSKYESKDVRERRLRREERFMQNQKRRIDWNRNLLSSNFFIELLESHLLQGDVQTVAVVTCSLADVCRLPPKVRSKQATNAWGIASCSTQTRPRTPSSTDTGSELEEFRSSLLNPEWPPRLRALDGPSLSRMLPLPSREGALLEEARLTRLEENVPLLRHLVARPSFRSRAEIDDPRARSFQVRKMRMPPQLQHQNRLLTPKEAEEWRKVCDELDRQDLLAQRQEQRLLGKREPEIDWDQMQTVPAEWEVGPLVVFDSRSDEEAEPEAFDTQHIKTEFPVIMSEVLDRFEDVRVQYAEILARWGFFKKSAEVLKFCPSQQPDPFVEIVACEDCGIMEGELAGDECRRCGADALTCALCHLSCAGLVLTCSYCSHGGHVDHMRQWFREQQTCPFGCGCLCPF